MPRKFLTQIEIENLMKNLDEENFDDSDSEFEDEFENSILENNEIELDVSANFDEEADGLFSWKEVEGSEMINVLPFSSKVGLKVDAISFKTENDFLMLTDEILAVLVEETNRYAFDLLNLHGESSDKRKHASSWKPTDKNEILKFLGHILLMGHIEKDSIQDYWTTDNLIETPIFREVMPRDRFLMILKFLHFSDNSLKESRDSPTYDRLWKIRKVFDSFNGIFKEVYDPTENLSFDEVIIKFKGRVLFKQYILKKRKQWGLKMYKIADATGYTYDMRVYLGKDKKENLSTSASYNVVYTMTDCIKGKGHKVFMDNFFSSPELFRDLLKERSINSCGTVRSNRKHFPKDLAPCKMRQGDVAVKFCNGMTALCWKDKRQVYMLTNMHSPRNELITEERKRFKKKFDGGVYLCEKEKLTTTKPKVVADYNKHMGYVDLGDRMSSTYSFARRTRKWTKKLFFSLIDIAVLNAFLMFKSCRTSSKFSLKEFRMNLITSLIGKINHKNAEHSVTKKAVQFKMGILDLEFKRAVGSLVVRASDSRPEGLGSMLDVTKYPPSAHGFTCRNCGGGDRGRVAIYRPFGEVSLSLNRTVTCMVLKANDRRTSCHATMNFVGLVLTTSDRSNESQYSRKKGSGQRREREEKGTRFKIDQGERHTGTASNRIPLFALGHNQIEEPRNEERSLWDTKCRSTLVLENQRGSIERV
ncbi:piggyBac transposable element-derived protein 4 [Trichonephila clavipes]|nr:piggyBac transposable element-derived protein 4 [Trichonephila clavipes]